jgi:hypothetical protein
MAARTSNGEQQQARARWSSAVQRWRGSGLTMRRWCAQEQLSYWQFCKWRRRLEAKPEALTLIPVVAGAARGGLVVRLSGGASIEVQPGFDAALLAAVVRALGSGTTC